MRRDQLEDLLRELARVSGKRDVVIIGSQSIFASVSRVPAEVTLSIEVDVLIEAGDPAEAVIVRALGKSSAYQAEHRVYVDPVPASFPFLPDGWEGRLQDLTVGELTARCLEIHDLVLSKLTAGRLKDNELIAALIGFGHVDVDVVHARIAAVGDLHLRATLMARLQLVFENVGS